MKKPIESIEIEYNEVEEIYKFSCPYCGAEFILPDSIECKHYWFGCEGINRHPLEMCNCLRSAIGEKLLDHHARGPESFFDLWLDEYRPEREGDSESYAKEYDSAREEYIEYYLESVISMDDVLWFMDRLPQFRGYRSHTTIATVDDGEGNDTSYLFLDDSFDPQ